MRGRPLSSITTDELSEMVNTAKQEHRALAQKFDVLEFEPVLSFLALLAAVESTYRSREAEKFFAKPWYRRILP